MSFKKKFDNRKTGILFLNTEKFSEESPDVSGSWTDSLGVKIDIVGWYAETNAGKAIRLMAKIPRPEQGAPQHAYTPPQGYMQGAGQTPPQQAHNPPQQAERNVQVLSPEGKVLTMAASAAAQLGWQVITAQPQPDEDVPF